jgi:osmoprotectant transport system permease protein
MSDATPAPDLVAQVPPRRHRGSTMSYLYMPGFLVLACLGLYLYVSSHDLDTIEARALNFDSLSQAIWEHVRLTAVSTALVILIAIPLGILLTRRFTRRIRPYLLVVINLAQAIPTIGILFLLAVAFLFLGFKSAIVGLVLYAVVPVLLNTMIGLEQVDESVLEAARGMGMSKFGVLRSIELPLAVPVILAGIRTALVINVGTATLATYIDAGGLGDIIVAGLSNNRTLVQITGAALTAVLALLIDYGAGIAEDLLRPRGL